MNRPDGIRRSACASAAVALPARGESARNVLDHFSEFDIDFRTRDRVASDLVDLSMLTEDGKVRR